MSGLLQVEIEGLASLESMIQEVGKKVETAAFRAINKTADRSRAASAKRIREQVNFPAQYLSSSENGRLSVIKKAKGGDLSAVIRGRDRATSLARFSRTGYGPRSRFNPTLEVKPGVSSVIGRSFLIRLRAGTASLDTKSNLGLAIRLRPGETIRNKRQMVRMAKNLYLLYGPSVAQVFASVAKDVEPETAAFLEQEFARLLKL